MKNRARQRSRSPWWLDERLRRGFGGGIPCGRRALFQRASLRRSRRSRPSPLLRLALWKNASPRYQPGFFNRLLKREICLPDNQWMGNPPLRRAGAGNSAVWCPPRPAERSRGGGRHRRHHAMPMDKEKVCPSVRAKHRRTHQTKWIKRRSVHLSICWIVQHRRTHRQKVCPSAGSYSTAGHTDKRSVHLSVPSIYLCRFMNSSADDGQGSPIARPCAPLKNREKKRTGSHDGHRVIASCTEGLSSAALPVDWSGGGCVRESVSAGTWCAV